MTYGRLVIMETADQTAQNEVGWVGRFGGDLVEYRAGCPHTVTVRKEGNLFREYVNGEQSGREITMNSGGIMTLAGALPEIIDTYASTVRQIPGFENAEVVSPKGYPRVSSEAAA